MKSRRVKNMRNIINIMLVVLMVSAVSLGCVQQDQPDVTQVVDTDGDGWSDEQELTAGTDPENNDTDGDRYWDPLDENPLDPEIPVDWEALTEIETVPPTPTPTPTPVPTPTVKITKPVDGGTAARILTVKGYGSEPGATVRIHIYTEREGKRLHSGVGYPDENGNWSVVSVNLWPETGYIGGEEAVIYAEMTVSKPGVVCTYRSANVTVRRS
ncbi:MAG TPA: hypothetical protein EYP67_03605 [Methanosarcinales archaeon]|nr:hypothetical protein [Methanosarcinales archaeon]